jgi:hypothetical protein
MNDEINLHNTAFKDKTRKQWINFLYDCFANERSLILFGIPLYVKSFLIDTDSYNRKTASVIFSNEMAITFPNYNIK